MAAPAQSALEVFIDVWGEALQWKIGDCTAGNGNDFKCTPASGGVYHARDMDNCAIPAGASAAEVSRAKNGFQIPNESTIICNAPAPAT